MKTVCSLLVFLFLIGLPIDAAAQRDCHDGPATTVEVMPIVTVRTNGSSEPVNEPLDRHLAASDRDAVITALHALTDHHRMNCGNALRLFLSYDPRSRHYEANILVRGAEACWEQVQTTVVVVPPGGIGRSGIGGRPLGAVLDADAHGRVMRADTSLACPDATAPDVETPTAPDPPDPPEEPPPVPPASCAEGTDTTVLPSDPATTRLLDRIPASDREAVYAAILERLHIRCGHVLHVRIGRNEMGADYVVHMHAVEIGHSGPVVLGFEGAGEGRVWLENDTIAPDMPGGDTTVLAILQEIASRGFLS